MKHLYIDNAFYFITCSTFDNKPDLNTSTRKRIILLQIKKIVEKLEVKIYAFSILSDHIHTIWFIKNSLDLPILAQYLQGGSAYLLNKISEQQGRIWGEYFEKIITNKIAMQRIYGYVIGNPLKHHEVKNFKELARYPFSSFSQTVKKYGYQDLVKLVTDVIHLEFDEILL